VSSGSAAKVLVKLTVFLPVEASALAQLNVLAERRGGAGADGCHGPVMAGAVSRLPPPVQVSVSLPLLTVEAVKLGGSPVSPRRSP